MWHNTLSCSPLTYDIYATVLDCLTCFFLGFQPLSMNVFLSRFIDIQDLLDSGFTVVPLISFMLLVIAVPVCLNHITWSCTCVIAWACQLALSYVLAGLLSDNPRSSNPDLGVWTVVVLLYLIRMTQRKHELAVSCPDPLSSSFPLFGSRDSHLATREYLPVFYIVHLAFMLLGDLIFLRYCIMLYDNCVLVLLFLECILPLCFRTMILACTDAWRIYVRVFLTCVYTSQ